MTITKAAALDIKRWTERQIATRIAYYAGPTSWCWVPDCYKPAPKFCAGHATQHALSRRRRRAKR